MQTSKSGDVLQEHGATVHSAGDAVPIGSRTLGTFASRYDPTTGSTVLAVIIISLLVHLDHPIESATAPPPEP
jgi:hypothetical protein